MKKIVTLIASLILTSMVQAQTYTWGNVVLGTSSAAYTNTLDASGNIITGGNFTGTADFNPGGGFANLTSGTGVANAYVQKLSAGGVYSWAVAFTGTASSRVSGITTDASGNVYVTGYLSTGNIDLDPGAGTQVVTTPNVGMFVVKLNSAGTLVWAKSVVTGTTTTQIYGNSIGVRSNGEVWIGGHFKCTTNLSPLDFDPGAGVSNATSIGVDGYVIRLDASGNWLSNFSVGGAGDDDVNSVKIDASDNAYLGGHYTSSISAYSLTGTGAFVSKYNSANSLVWAKGVSSGIQCIVSDVDVDASGNVYSVGSFVGNPDFDPAAGTMILTGLSSNNGFVWKLDNAGSLVWAKQIGGNGDEVVNSISVAGSNVNVCGSYSNSIDLDPSSNFFSTVSVAASTTDAFIAKYSTSIGDFVSGQFLGASSNDAATCISSTSANDNYVSGYFNGTIDFNPASGTNNLTATGTANVFNVKYSLCTPPALPTITNPSAQNVCSGTSAVLTSSDASSSWYSSPSSTTPLAVGATFTSPVLTAATTYYLQATNTCGSPSSRVAVPITIISIPTTPSAIAGTVTICSGTSNTYSVASVSGVTYNWTLPSGWVGTSTINSINATASTTSGNVSVTAVNSCGTSTASTQAITVNSVPLTPSAITGTATICSGTTNTYSVSNVSGVTYNWTLPSGWTGTSTSNSINATASTTSGSVSVTAANSCGTSTASTKAITTVNSVPSIPSAITGTTTMCSGATNTYSVTNVSGVNYNWTLPSGWIGTSTSNSINVTSSTSSGTISVTATNTCGTSAASSQTITVNAAPATPGLVTGTTTICSGTANVYSVAAVSGATSYNWNLPVGWSGTSTSNSINATASTTSGNVSVTAVNSCGTSTASTQAITVNSAPSAPSAITGTSTICTGTTNTYSVTNVSGVTYNWTLPLGWQGISSSNVINATAGTSGGTISLVQSNACGSSPTALMIVTVNPSPNINVTSIPANGQVCQGSSITLNATGGVYYIWNYTTSGVSPTHVVTPTSSINYAVIGQSSAGCQDTVFYPIVVNPLPDTAVSVNGNILTSMEVGASSYQWYDCINGILATETNQQFMAQANGSYVVQVINANGCSAYSSCINVTGIGINEVASTNVPFSIYPNPSLGSFIIEMVKDEKGYYEILDVNGKLIKQGKIISSKITIDLVGANQGMYWAKVTTTSGVTYSKIILSN